VPKTLLAVDDSATMRKVLEITFSGDDFRVVAAENASGALALMREDPVAVLIDTGLGADDGYALAKAVRSRDARVAIVLMSSRYNPYDAGRGKDAGADDFVDKPFDTQGLVDKVKKAILARESARSVAPAPAAHAPPAAAPAPAHVAPPPAYVRSPATATGASPPAPSVKPAWPAQRTHTLSFEGGPPAAAPAPRGPSPGAVPLVTRAPVPPQPQAPAPPPEPARHAAHTAATAPPRGPEIAIPPAANGQLAHKLGELGLNPQQVEAVLALSREVVERVVWEVVPQLAETIIKEEITRLTKEG
jgi:CheY-like chemotaxis protein